MTDQRAHPKLERAVETAREVARSVIADHAPDVDARGVWPEASVTALQEAGLGGLAVPTRFGGLGLGLEGMARVCEEIGYACGSTGLAFGMHLSATSALSAAPTDEQVDRYVAPVVRGEHLATLALSEPGTGAHFWISESRARLLEDGYVLNGVKSFVTSAGHADSYVVSCVSGEPTDAVGDFSCFVIDRDARGLTFEGGWDGIGMRGNASGGMRMDDVHVDASGLLGSIGAQPRYLFEIITPAFLASIVGTYVGLGRAALDEAVAHVSSRRHAHTGRALANSPVVQTKIGTLWGQVEGLRALARAATRLGDAGNPDALPALATMKAEAAETVAAAVDTALNLCGGRGYVRGGRLDRLLRDSRAAGIMSPTTDLMRIWTGRHVLGLPLLAGTT